MASELSRLIEDELRHKGYAVDDDKEDEEAPHQALLGKMGALRVEVGLISRFTLSETAQCHVLPPMK